MSSFVHIPLSSSQLQNDKHALHSKGAVQLDMKGSFGSPLKKIGVGLHGVSTSCVDILGSESDRESRIESGNLPTDASTPFSMISVQFSES